MLMDVIKSNHGEHIKEIDDCTYVCACGTQFCTTSYRKCNFDAHLKTHKITSTVKTTVKVKQSPQITNIIREEPGSVCDGFWHRTVDGVDVTGMYHVEAGGRHGFYGVPKQRFYRGKVELRGTFRSVLCLKTSVLPGRGPNGMSMCNQCARIPFHPVFVRKVIMKTNVMVTPHAFTPNMHLSPMQKELKILAQARIIKLAKQRDRRRKKSRGVNVAKISWGRKDIAKFVMELNYIAQKGTLETRKVMWAYVQDVVRSEYLKARLDTGKYSRGMRWSADTKHLFASQKLMGGKRLNRSQRMNVGGPSYRTVGELFILYLSYYAFTIYSLINYVLAHITLFVCMSNAGM